MIILEHQHAPIPCFMNTVLSRFGFLHDSTQMCFYVRFDFRTGAVTGKEASSPLR